ncbi:hypothetical protein GGI20_004991 [Coemansia sp. BCRC 34301]|nr:hypothetical protein GGI20_004991 [Coemansia sp. BCRC 34301]
MSGLESVTPPAVTILQRAKQQQQPPLVPVVVSPNQAAMEAVVVADQILQDALCKSSDRAFLLDVEQQIIGFVDNTRIPRLSFPKQNSYRRLLLHKLADYYALSHVVAGRYRDEVVFYRKQNQNSLEWGAVCLPELLSAVVPPEYVVADDAPVSGECDLDDSAGLASPVTPSFTKILVKKRDPADGADSKRRASRAAAAAAAAAAPTSLADGGAGSVEDAATAAAAATASMPSSGVGVCCEKLAAVSVGGRTKTIEQRQAEYERARAEIFQDDEKETRDSSSVQLSNSNSC